MGCSNLCKVNLPCSTTAEAAVVWDWAAIAYGMAAPSTARRKSFGFRIFVGEFIAQRRYPLLRPGFRNLGQNFALLFRRAAEVVFGQAIAQELEGFFRRVDKLELVE